MVDKEMDDHSITRVVYPSHSYNKEHNSSTSLCVGGRFFTKEVMAWTLSYNKSSFKTLVSMKFASMGSGSKVVVFIRLEMSMEEYGKYDNTNSFNYTTLYYK